VTIYLVRHAQAGSRHDWAGDDLHRPLSAKGWKQATALAELFADRPITRILSSTYVRCIQTVEPLAERKRMPVETSDPLTEGASTKAALDLVRSLRGTDAVLCSHGDVVPAVINALAGKGIRINGRRSAAKGGTFVIEDDGAKFVSATYLPPPGK
jgi:8-oxo-dGTP diphosphatase